MEKSISQDNTDKSQMETAEISAVLRKAMPGQFLDVEIQGSPAFTSEVVIKEVDTVTLVNGAIIFFSGSEWLYSFDGERVDGKKVISVDINEDCKSCTSCANAGRRLIFRYFAAQAGLEVSR
jgi:hypothetical protein